MREIAVKNKKVQFRIVGIILLSHFAAVVISLAAVLLNASASSAATHEKADTALESHGAESVEPNAVKPGESKTAKSEAPANLKTKKSTDVNFDDVLVQGKYHFSDEAVTTVEQDKILDALLGVRTDFKDRLSKSAARH